MPVAGAGIGFWVQGEPIEPAHDLAWHVAPQSLRRQFWRNVAGLVEEIYGREREAGINRFGRLLVPLRPRTIAHRHSAMGPADPTAPPLIPAHGLSRTVSLLVTQATDRGVWCRWRSWERQSWGQILTWHAKGLVQGAPARDVMGLSPAGIQKVAEWARKWWERKRPVAWAEIHPQQLTFTTPGLAVTGRPPVPVGVDLDRFVFGTGQRQQVERMAASGQFTGFRQFRPGGGPRGLDRLKSPRPTPPKPPTPPVVPLKPVAITPPKPIPPLPKPIVVAPPKPQPEPKPVLVLPTQVEQAILLLTGGTHKRVPLVDLRAALPGIGKAELDRILIALAARGRIGLTRWDDPLIAKRYGLGGSLYTPSGERRDLVFWLGR